MLAVAIFASGIPACSAAAQRALNCGALGRGRRLPCYAFAVPGAPTPPGHRGGGKGATATAWPLLSATAFRRQRDAPNCGAPSEDTSTGAPFSSDVGIPIGEFPNG
jgi:hypothetical protein